MNMTIQDLYNFAKENNVLDYKLYAECECGNDIPCRIENIDINKEFKEITF